MTWRPRFQGDRKSSFVTFTRSPSSLHDGQGSVYGVNTPLFGSGLIRKFLLMNIAAMADLTANSGRTAWPAFPPLSIGSSSPEVARSSGETLPKLTFSPAPVLPDPSFCRARRSGRADYAGYLVENLFRCPHPISFDCGFSGHHLERNQIVLRTSDQGR